MKIVLIVVPLTFFVACVIVAWIISSTNDIKAEREVVLAAAPADGQDMAYGLRQGWVVVDDLSETKFNTIFEAHRTDYIAGELTEGEFTRKVFAKVNKEDLKVQDARGRDLLSLTFSGRFPPQIVLRMIQEVDGMNVQALISNLAISHGISKGMDETLSTLIENNLIYPGSNQKNILHMLYDQVHAVELFDWLKERVPKDTFAQMLVARRPAGEMTPLQLSVAGDSLELVQRFIAAGSDVDSEDGRGETPLTIAINKESKEKFHLLLDSGADPHAVSQKTGQSAIDLLKFYGLDWEVPQ